MRGAHVFHTQVASAGAQALLRAGSGAFVSDKLPTFRNRPQKPIELYEFEGCPFCRKVRVSSKHSMHDSLFQPIQASGRVAYLLCTFERSCFSFILYLCAASTSICVQLSDESAADQQGALDLWQCMWCQEFPCFLHRSCF